MNRAHIVALLVVPLAQAASPPISISFRELVTMPWILRFAISIFVIGVVIIAWACMSTGWETLSWFAWGCVTAGAGLIGTTLLAIVSAVIYQGWRRFSLALMSASVLLFIALLIFANFA
jgi:hypothetical protein